MTKLSTDAFLVLNHLRDHAENGMRPGWGMIYLDNARKGMPDKKFRSLLGVLSKARLYKVVDGWAWGEVKLED